MKNKIRFSLLVVFFLLLLLQNKNAINIYRGKVILNIHYNNLHVRTSQYLQFLFGHNSRHNSMLIYESNVWAQKKFAPARQKVEY